jgi:GWxTD domain-containing protein
VFALFFAISLLGFGNGPEQWLMTSEEQRAWRNVKTEEQARDFADLFWARRDPTPGTPNNEFRSEFDSRVAYADKNFKEGKKRGALTERGRVLVVLGFPSNLTSESEKKTSQFVMGQSRNNPDPTGGRAMAAREDWFWEHKDAVKYGMPKIEVVFFYDGRDGAARRDPQRPDFTHALQAAIKYPIKNPELTEVPDWARSGIRFEESAVFGSGPEQWLMTTEESREAKKKTREFADVFWVRRDPTPGTPRNEFREDFEARVDFADKNFEEDGKRGSLTERGRILVVFGMPTQVAASTWIWDYKDAEPFGMRAFKVNFVYVDGKIRGRRDPDGPDFNQGFPGAIKSIIKNPELTSVPEWANAPAATAAAPPSESPTPAAAAEAGAAPAPATLRMPSSKPAPPAGAAKLTLVSDAFALQPQSGKDPFDGLSSRGQFAKEAELGWAFEYCTGNATTELPPLTVGLKVSGPKEGELTNFTAPDEEMVPDSIRASPGCFLVRGSIPLVEMDSGTYDLAVTVGKYNLTREFKIE